MNRSTDPRRASALATAAFVAVAAAAFGLWWLHGRSTIIADWRQVAACEPSEHLEPRVNTSPRAASCSGPLTLTDPEPSSAGRLVISVIVHSGDGERAAVGSVSSDRSGRRVTVIGAPEPTGGSGARTAIGIATLVFLSIPAADLPSTPFTLVDDAGQTTVRSVGP
jgi:hypothetical protein